MSEDTGSNPRPLSDPKLWIDLHGDALFGFALNSVRNRTVAEDLVQETFLAAFKGRSNFSGHASERTWLISILKNKVVDHFRKTGRESSLDSPDELIDTDDTDYVISGAGTGTWAPGREPQKWFIDPNDPVEKEQFWKYLRQCMDGLDERSAQVYSLRELLEIDIEIVCNVLELSPTNLRVLMHRARKKLRHCLEVNWIGDN